MKTTSILKGPEVCGKNGVAPGESSLELLVNHVNYASIFLGYVTLILNCVTQ